MSRMCEICGKGYQKNNLVPRGVGNRVTKRTGVKKMANLRSKRFDLGGSKVKVIICSGCLKRVKKDMALMSEVHSHTSAVAK